MRIYASLLSSSSFKVYHHKHPRLARSQLNIGVTFLLPGAGVLPRSTSTDVLLCAAAYPDGYTDWPGCGLASYPANPGGGILRFVGVVGVLLEGGVLGGRPTGMGVGAAMAVCLRIAVGGWPIMRESDQGTSMPERPAEATYLAISRWSVG